MPENQKGRGNQGENNRGNQGGSQGNSLRGLASADKATRERVAREGGKASHEKGTGHEWNSREAREAGKKGGEKSHGGR